MKSGDENLKRCFSVSTQLLIDEKTLTLKETITGKRRAQQTPVLLSAWNNSAPTGPIETNPEICAFSRKSVEKIQVSIK
jgi:hypothetical protein